MIKNITSFFAKKSSLLVLICAFLISNRTMAQINVTIGTGTTTNSGTGYPCALQDYYEGSRMQFLYLASEMTAAGMSAGNIDTIKYRITALNGTGVIENLKITIGHTTVNSLSSSAWDPFSGATASTTTANYTPIVGINSFKLTSSFFWNGADNILIEVCNGAANTSGTTFTNNPSIPLTSGLSFNGSHSYRDDNLVGPLCVCYYYNQ